MNEKIKIEIAVGIIVFAAIVFGGAFWLGNRNNPKSTLVPPAQKSQSVPVAQQPLQSVTNQKQVTQSADETSEWQTYSEPEDNFSFKYPEKISSIEEGLRDSVAQVDTYYLGNVGMLYVYKNISKKNGFGYDSLQELMTAEEAKGFKSETKIFGQNTWYCNNQEGLDGTKRYACNLQNGNTVYTLVYFIQNDINLSMEEFNLIVKSFQVTN